jgi:hypothetical protein
MQKFQINVVINNKEFKHVVNCHSFKEALKCALYYYNDEFIISIVRLEVRM